MSIDVSSLPSGNIADDGSFHARSLDTGHYKHELWPVDGKDISVFSDQINAYDKAAYIARGNKIVSVDVNSNDTPDAAKLDAALMSVLKSLSWLN